MEHYIFSHNGSYWPNTKFNLKWLLSKWYSLVSWTREWKTTFSVHIGSDWPDFKFGVQNGVCRNDIFLTGKRSFAYYIK